MNWMGGVRNRLKVRNERKRQQDFFEKQKFTNKQRKLETKTCSSQKKQPVSLDLVSLQAANFSAAHFKQHGSKKISGGRINRVDLDKSRGLFRQKFVNLPDASPETKPSALNLNKPSPQESVSCSNLLLTSRRHTLSTITEDSSYSLIQSDINTQDLSQMPTCQSEQSHFWTSTPANFWHKRKGKRPNRHNAILDSKSSNGKVDDQDPVFHSPSTSEKLLLDSSREQMRTIDGCEYWAGKTPGSNTSGWSDLSTIMEDTDEATVPSMDDDEWDYQDVGGNRVSSQSFPESIQSHDVPTSQWTLETAGEETLLDAPDSTLSSFKDCHKTEYPIGDSEMEDSTRFAHQMASEQYSSTHQIKVDCNIRNRPQPEHITIDYQPENAPPRDQLIAKKVRKRVQVVDERQSRNLIRYTDHQAKGQTFRPPAHHDPLLHQYADNKEQRDLACHESASFTSPEDSSTYLMTECAKMDNYQEHLNVQDSKADQRHHWYNDTSWQYPNSYDTIAKGGDVNSVGVHTSAQELMNANYISNGDYDQEKNLQLNRTVGDKFTRGQKHVSGHLQDHHVDIMKLYSCETKQSLPVGFERVDMMQDQPCSNQPSMLSQIHDSNGASLVDSQDKNKSSIDVDSDGDITSDFNNEDDAESSASSDCSSTDDSPDMDLAEGADASCNNWLDFVHDLPEVNRTETVRKAKELQGDERQIKDVPATAQQMLEEVLALDRELHKETLAVDKDDVSGNTRILVDGKDRTVEKLSDKQLEVHTEDTLLGLQDIKSQVPDLKTTCTCMLASSTRNTKPEETEREQVHGDQGIAMKDRQAHVVKGNLSSNVSSSQTEETGVASLRVKSPDMTTKTVCDISGSFISQTDDVSTTVVFIDKESGSTLIMPSIVPTSTSAETFADSNTQGEKILCDSSVQCTLIGDPLSMPKGRERLEVSNSSVQSSDDITVPSLDVMKVNNANASNADDVSSQENGFESCVSTP